MSFAAQGDGRAVEVLGELRTAERVVVLVPGVDTRVADFDRGLGGVRRRALGVQARAVYGAVRTVEPHAQVAVVAWLGYDAPEGMSLEVARDLRAREGAAALTRFVRELPGSAPVVLVGHSYGAVVAGLAARDSARVTDVVALGAPGSGVQRASELRGTRVWSALAAGDWIRRVPQVRVGRLGHGRRPSAPGFGAVALPVGGVAGHDFYLSPGSATLTAVAQVATGTFGTAAAASGPASAGTAALVDAGAAAVVAP